MYYDAELNVSVYEVADPSSVVAHFPDARQLSDVHVAIPCTLKNLQELAALEVTTIAPLDAYDWPHGPMIKKPHDIQRIMANFLVLHPRCFNLSEMRTGKTLASLWAADYLMQEHEREGKLFKALIVAPLRTLARTWGDTIFQHFLGRRKYAVLHGTAAKRLEALQKDVDFYIINYDGLETGLSYKSGRAIAAGFAKELSEREDIQLVIIDESSAYKTPSTMRHKTARHLIGNRPYLWMMTGTPTANGPLDAYGQAKLLNGAYGETLAQYKDRIMTRVTQFKWVPKSGAAEAAIGLLTPHIRFTQEDCFELPDLEVIVEECEMSKDQRKAYDEMKKELTIQLKAEHHITAMNEGALRLKLIQIACGALYDKTGETHFIDAKPRLEALKEIIEKAPHKIIVFAPLTSVVNLLYSVLSKQYECVIVDGNVSKAEADKRLLSFQEGNTHILIAHPGPISRGLDLTAASTIVWFAPTDKTEEYLQANQRINGPRQKHKRTIVQISACPIEQEIYKRLEHNETMQGVVLALARSGK